MKNPVMMIKRLYDPKTAFGNPLLIKAIQEADELEDIKPEPGKVYDADGAYLTKTVILYWECGNCSNEHENDVDDEESDYKMECEKCGAINEINP